MKKKKYVVVLIIIFVLLYFLAANKYKFFLLEQEKNRIKTQELEEERQKKEQLKNYEKCLKNEYVEEMVTVEITNQQQKIKKYLNKYNVSIKYTNLSNKYDFEYLPKKVYYGASLYKLLDVLYLIEKSNNNELNLDDELIYLIKYRRSSSTGMQKHSLNEKISIKTLLSYVLEYSDNTAHTILVNDLGLKNLQNYGESLGAKYKMGNDTYGNLDIRDLNIYMTKLNELILFNNDNSLFLKKHLNNSNDNSLNTSLVNFFHKYGMYDIFYHDAGISITDNPYMLLVLSEERKTNYSKIFENISNDFYELNSLLIESQQIYCQNLIYGGENNGY